jgi:hypothetical protein
MTKSPQHNPHGDILAQLQAMSRPELGPSDDPASVDMPHLWRLLTARMAGGQLREPGRVSIQAVPGAWRVIYTDADLGLTCTVDCQRLGETITTLERALIGQHPAQWSEMKRGKASVRLKKRLEEEAQKERERPNG